MVLPTSKKVGLRTPEAEELTTWEQLPSASQNVMVHVYGIIAEVKEVEGIADPGLVDVEVVAVAECVG